MFIVTLLYSERVCSQTFLINCTTGPSGTGKTYLAQRLAEYLTLLEGRTDTHTAITTLNVDHKSSKVRTHLHTHTHTEHNCFLFDDMSNVCNVKLHCEILASYTSCLSGDVPLLLCRN